MFIISRMKIAKIKKYLEWAEKQTAGFTWKDFQDKFGPDTQEFNQAMSILRANRPQGENLIDHYDGSKNPNSFILTRNGLAYLNNLRSRRRSLSYNPWLIGIGLLILSPFISSFINPFLRYFHPDEWQPIYYPNPPDLTFYINGPTVDTLEECRDWIDAEAIRRGQAAGEYDYECALNCDLNDDLYVCEETTQ